MHSYVGGTKDLFKSVYVECWNADKRANLGSFSLIFVSYERFQWILKSYGKKNWKKWKIDIEKWSWRHKSKTKIVQF